MNPLSILNGASRATGLASDARDSANQDDAGAQDQFSRILDASQRADNPYAQQASLARNDGPDRQTAKPRNQDQGQDKDRNGRERDEPRTTEGRQDKGSARAQRTDGSQRGAADKAGKPASDAGTKTEATDTAGDAGDTPPGDEAGTWPPAGLGGFGMMLLQGTPAAPAAAALAGSNAAATGLAGLADANATAPGAANTATAAAPATLALPGLASGAAATTAATASPDATAPQALVALANAARLEAGDAAATVADSADATATPFVLPTLSHTAPARALEAGAITSANPTPTPDLHGDGFDEAVGTRLTWLAEQKIGHAHIKITPNDLGPVEVSLKMDGDRIHASFSAAHADVRQALEQSLPRLRDMLGEHGFQLAQADVGARQQGQPGNGGNAPAGFGGLADGAAEDATPVVVPASVLRARGLLDAYA